jgi:hypothetical protein
MFIGTHLNESEDALDFGEYSDRWINRFMQDSDRWTHPFSAIREAMIQDLHSVLEKHCAPLATIAAGSSAGKTWGWKEPRSIYLLRFWHSQFPALKFLHLVRDGRDMAYSTNQNQLMKHGSTLLEPTKAHWSQPVRSIALWSRINLLAADYGEKHLRGQYLRIRFEDLCAEPILTTHRIFAFFGLKGDAQRIAELDVRPPASLERWRNQDQETLTQLHRIGAAALQRFGYWTPERVVCGNEL